VFSFRLLLMQCRANILFQHRFVKVLGDYVLRSRYTLVVQPVNTETIVKGLRVGEYQGVIRLPKASTSAQVKSMEDCQTSYDWTECVPRQ